MADKSRRAHELKIMALEIKKIKYQSASKAAEEKNTSIRLQIELETIRAQNHQLSYAAKPQSIARSSSSQSHTTSLSAHSQHSTPWSASSPNYSPMSSSSNQNNLDNSLNQSENGGMADLDFPLMQSTGGCSAGGEFNLNQFLGNNINALGLVDSYNPTSAP